MSDAVTERPPRPDATGPVPIIDAPRAADAPAPADGTEPPAPPKGPVARVRHAFARFLTMPIEGWVSLAIVGVCVVFVWVQAGQGLLLTNTTPAGGDMGAHVWGPAFLRDHLLTHGRITGWTRDWYAGFPAYQFYMVIPSLAIAVLSWLVPYGVAFKLVAVSGLLSLPIAAWAFGRLTRLPFPVPPMLAVAATLFLFDRSFSIYGGNVASTLAGEFAFSISLSFAVVYLGVLGRGLEDGKHRGWAALLLALTGLCHVIPLLFALAGTVVWFVLRPGVARVKYLLTMLPVGGALMAWWLGPFYLRSRYLNDMGWEKKENYVNYLFQRAKLDPQLVDSPPIKWILAFAAVGALMAIVYRRRGAIFWVAMAVVSALAFVYVPQSRLWNARVLPFYYLSLYLLAAVAVGEVLRTIASLVARDPTRPVRTVRVVGAGIALVLALAVIAMPLHAMPNTIGPIELGEEKSDGTYQWLFLSTRDNSFVDSWAKWNFEGYERKAAYPEYYALMETMAQLGDTNGCGRAMWEHEEQHDRYGTPMALMLLPFWTDGCIGSMEGLYFEASSTTPYHFLNQDELSSAPSNAQRDLPYSPGAPSRADFDLGVQHLQMLGVKYYMAISDRMIQFGRASSSLTEVAATGPWVIFEVGDSPLVQGLDNEPAVVNGVDTQKSWLKMSVDWYMDPSAWPVPLTDGGPADWQRIDVGQTPDEKPLDPVQVTDISEDDGSLSFEVDRTGVPVLVKTSYFPNWEASGAEGPWRVTPNLMVVVPTSNKVELHYGYTSVEALTYAVSLLGVVGLVWLFLAAPISMPEPRRWRRRSPEDDAATMPDGDGDGDGYGDGGAAVPVGQASVAAVAATGPPYVAPHHEHTEPAATFDPVDAILGPVADVGTDEAPSPAPDGDGDGDGGVPGGGT